jgi:hypothetical protein
MDLGNGNSISQVKQNPERKQQKGYILGVNFRGNKGSKK